MCANPRILFLLLGVVFLSTSGAFAQNGSIWNMEPGKVSGSLYADPVATQIGDLVTIIVNLSTTASKNQSTATAKQTGVNDTINALGYPQSDGMWDWYRFRNLAPTMNWSANQSFDGSGKLNNQETLVTTVQARIVNVLPNGTLQIEARRNFEAGKEKSSLVLTGLVRKQDLDLNNQISSTKIADLQIKQEGSGPLSSSQKKGWLTRIYETISPF